MSKANLSAGTFWVVRWNYSWWLKLFCGYQDSGNSTSEQKSAVILSFCTWAYPVLASQNVGSGKGLQRNAPSVSTFSQSSPKTRLDAVQTIIIRWIKNKKTATCRTFHPILVTLTALCKLKIHTPFEFTKKKKNLNPFAVLNTPKMQSCFLEVISDQTRLSICAREHSLPSSLYSSDEEELCGSISDYDKESDCRSIPNWGWGEPCSTVRHLNIRPWHRHTHLWRELYYKPPPSAAVPGQRVMDKWFRPRQWQNGKNK